MQNLTEGMSVSYQGQIARVVKVHPYTVELVLENGTNVTTFKNDVEPRSFLTEGQ